MSSKNPCFFSFKNRREHNNGTCLIRIFIFLDIYSEFTAFIVFFCVAATAKNNEVSYQVGRIARIQDYIGTVVQNMASHTLSVVDYILLVILLLSSSIIGVLFGFFKSKRSSAQEFLLGMMESFS